MGSESCGRTLYVFVDDFISKGFKWIALTEALLNLAGVLLSLKMGVSSGFGLRAVQYFISSFHLMHDPKPYLLQII